jgi:uncharacterized protein YbaA (DUF1428 family)
MSDATYVDGFLTAVPTANREAYRETAATAAEVFREHGALACVECWGDDVPVGKVNDMHGAVQRRDDETVVFSWIAWPSKAVRDEALPKVMADPRLAGMAPDVMPFDGSRMIMGGFEVLLDA